MSFEEKSKKLQSLIEISELQEKYFEELYKYGMMIMKLNKTKNKERRKKDANVSILR